MSTVTGPIILTAAEMAEADALAVKGGVASALVLRRSDLALYREFLGRILRRGGSRA